MKNRVGTSLIEALVALTVLGALITMTLSAVNAQIKLFSSSSAQIDAIQNGRFALNAMEKDLPTTGTNIAAYQPFLVYADTHVVAFNADYLSNRLNDISAIYIDTAASDAYSTAVTRARRFAIPRTNVAYPDSNYRSGSSNSPAETIIFYFQPDTITPRTDDYMLWRKVNDQPADMLARGILRDGGTPFFRYQRKITPTSGNASLQEVAPGLLPLRHVAELHGAVADTGALAIIDQLRAVTVSFRVTDDSPDRQERIYTIARTIALPNAGLATKMTCGDEPLLGTVGFTATPMTVDARPVIRLTWTAAADETGGERDVVRYVLYRENVAGSLSDPLLSVPAGQSAYTYDDAAVEYGQLYFYSIAAQDCTPALSDPIAAPPVIP